MQYVRFIATTGYVGTDEVEYVCFKHNRIEKELNEWARDFSLDNAEQYEYLATDNICEEDYETIEEYENALENAYREYYEEVYGSWEFVDAAEWEANEGYYNEN